MTNEELNQIKDELTKIPSCPGYAADRNGGIWSIRSNWRGYGVRKLIEELNNHNYLTVRIQTKIKRKRFAVHTLIAEAFLGQRPKNMQIRHIDGNPLNNKIANLKYGTCQENATDRDLHGRTQRGSKHSRAKLSEHNVFMIKKYLEKNKMTYKQIAIIFGVTAETIGQIKNGKLWKHVTA